MQTVAFGGGNNSTAMVCEMVRRGEPIDVATMADPGSEYPHTYAFLETMNAWLTAREYQPIVVVQNDGMYRTLEKNCLAKKMLPSIVYGFKRCSDKYKIRPQNKYIAKLPEAQAIWKAGGKVTKCIGYHGDETHRATITEDKHYRYRYPLIEWGMGQEDCIAAILLAGLTPPGKSSCFFCPSHSAHQVVALNRNHPELMKRALAMEANAMPNLITVKGLGRNWSWAEVIAADKAQIDMFRSPPAMPCVCVDGEEDE